MHPPVRRLVGDTAIEKHAHGRSTSTPCSKLARAAIVASETTRLVAMSDRRFCALVDSGALHCKVMATLLGRTRTFGSYNKGHETLVAKLNNTGTGTASEIVSEIVLRRVTGEVSSFSKVADIVAAGREVEVKISYQDETRNARNGHQVNIQRTQLGAAEYLMAALVDGPGSVESPYGTTTVRWVFAPMSEIASHIEAAHPGQSAKSSVTLPLRPSTAQTRLGRYTHNSSESLLAALRCSLG